jgi:hypothetical protein
MSTGEMITISRDGQQYGPYTVVEVENYLATGSLVSTDLAWNNSTSAWVPLSAYPGLRKGAALPPPSGQRNIFLVIVMGLIWWIGLEIVLFVVTCVISAIVATSIYPNDTPHDAGYKLGHSAAPIILLLMAGMMGLVIWLTVIGKLPGTGFKRK